MSATAEAQKRRQLVILFFTLVMALAGFSIILPILPFYAEDMGASATDLGLLFAVYSLMQFVFAPLWGQYSDRVGRRPVLLIGLTGLSLSLVLFGLAWSLWMLYLARILGGLLSSAVLPTAMAYIADSTDYKGRGRGMGLMGAAMGLGIIIGPLLGGAFAALSGPTVPFFIASGITLLVTGLAALSLPESLSPEARARGAARSRGAVYGQLLSALSSASGPVLTLGFLTHFGLSGLFGTFALFAEAKLGFGEGEVGIIITAMGAVSFLVQSVVVGRAINRWGEARVIQWGFALGGLGFLSLLLAYDLVSFLLLTSVVGVSTALLNPATSSLVSKRTPDDRQGSMLGALSSYQSLGRIVGPILSGWAFDSLGYSYPYWMAGALFLIVWLSSGLFLRPRMPVPAEGGE